MEYLVTAPPVIIPSEPASGAFLLAAGLAARGADAAFLDLSAEFFSYIFSDEGQWSDSPPMAPAMNYLKSSSVYEPQGHRTASGILNSRMRLFSKKYQGWKISLMDAVPPVPVHSPERLQELLENEETPFAGFWEQALEPMLSEHEPKKVLVSISYLSQLPAGIDLVRFLRRTGRNVIVGGSLMNSLARTGSGFRLLSRVFPEIQLGDGSEFPGFSSTEPLLSHLRWPRIIGGWNYISGRPVIPFTASTGCYWNSCLFCPDADDEFRQVGARVLESFLDSVPQEIIAQEPIIHFLDSAVPRGALLDCLPILKNHGLSFYTFARPEKWLLDITEELAEAGCLMLQLGAESGSRRLLDRFQKGIDPTTALSIIKECARAGIRTYVYMLSGLPGETEEDIELTADFLKNAGSSIDFINFSVFNLPSHCKLTDSAEDFGIQLLQVPEDQNAIHLYKPFLCNGENPRKAARRCITEKYRIIPSVQEAVKRTPKWFRTSHFPMIHVTGRMD